MLIVLALTLTFLSFFFKKSKIISVLIFSLMWILFGWNTKNADTAMYEGMYNIPLSKINFLKYEGGYDLLMYCGKYLGFNYQLFHIIIAGIVLLLFLRFFLIFSNVTAFSSICFFWFFFPLQFVIFRNFIALAIVLQGLIAVFKNEKHNKLIFVFFVLLASTIHVSSLFYFIFLLAFQKDEIKILRVFIWVSVLLLMTIAIHPYINSILYLFPKNKLEFYNTRFLVFFVYSIIQISNLYVIKYFLKFDSDSYNLATLRENTFIINMNIMMLFLIVVYYEFAVFIRILWNLSIVNVVFIANKSFLLDSNNTPKYLFLIYLLFWFFCFIYIVKESTILPLFYNNLLFNN